MNILYNYLLTIKWFCLSLILPKSKNEDIQRSEFILNILLLSIIILFAVAFLIASIDYLSKAPNYRGLSPFVDMAIFLFFITLFILSRKGCVLLSSLLLICIIFLFATYMGYRWGVDLPAEILLYSVIIVMSGILISTRFAFITTLIICATVIITGYLHNLGTVEVNRYWVNQTWTVSEITVASILFFVIATVSWLSNREIEKSLKRARKSEAELKAERDSLEIKVEERTKELKEVQAEKMTQLYRFAEFGRLSSGLFHDLINPLNAVSLNIGQLKNQVAIGGRETAVPVDLSAIASVKADVSAQAISCVDRAVSAAKRLEGMVTAVRKQLARQENKTNFSLKEEIEGVISVLSHKAQKEGVIMRFLFNEDISLFGDAMKFNQIALNLIANAIDAYSMVRGLRSKGVVISLKQNGDNAVFAVKDWGVGIPNENKQKIFEPFFTTKAEAGGIGIGLSMTKRITEKDFGGDIEVLTKEGEGSEFVARFPLKIAE